MKTGTMESLRLGACIVQGLLFERHWRWDDLSVVKLARVLEVEHGVNS